ncbi:integrase, partial [Streptomyces fungicidicus]
WHLEQDHPKPNMRGARAVLNAYRDRLAEQKAEAARARQATAALPAQIRAMLAGTDRTTFAGRRNAALVLLGFATAARVSELVALDVAAVGETEHGYDVTVYRKKVRRHTTNAIFTAPTRLPAPSAPCAPTAPP